MYTKNCMLHLKLPASKWTWIDYSIIKASMSQPHTSMLNCKICVWSWWPRLPVAAASTGQYCTRRGLHQMHPPHHLLTSCVAHCCSSIRSRFSRCSCVDIVLDTCCWEGKPDYSKIGEPRRLQVVVPKAIQTSSHCHFHSLTLGRQYPG